MAALLRKQLEKFRQASDGRNSAPLPSPGLQYGYLKAYAPKLTPTGKATSWTSLGDAFLKDGLEHELFRYGGGQVNLKVPAPTNQQIEETFKSETIGWGAVLAASRFWNAVEKVCVPEELKTSETVGLALQSYTKVIQAVSFENGVASVRFYEEIVLGGWRGGGYNLTNQPDGHEFSGVWNRAR